MTQPHYSDDWLTIYGGDCREVLASLPSDSVDCVVTSPPYWGLRDYGTATWTGGDEGCDHRPAVTGRAQRPAGGLTGGKAHVDAGTIRPGDCGRCGATRADSQLGLERTPEEYVANMVAVFAEVRRVLKPSGTCWLNLGDTMNNRTRVRPSSHQPALNGIVDGAWADTAAAGGVRMSLAGDLKEKDLVGIPWMVAFALRADGWYLRSDIIWAKPNPMPESVTDRPTKSARYYFDQESVREPEKPWNGGMVRAPKMGPERLAGAGKAGTTEKRFDVIKGANIRSVWNIATRPYPGAHFAVFPPELPERCIKAGSSERGVCPECGAPWERVVERTAMVVRPGPGREGMQDASTSATKRTAITGTMVSPASAVTTGWVPTCPATCPHPQDPPVPAVVLDPFGGSGTVGMVANRLSRRAILIDLNPEYLKQQMTRNAQTPLGLTEGDAA